MLKKLVIIYPSDPFGGKVGGINSFIKGLIKYAPIDFEIEWIGITSDPAARPVLLSKHYQMDGRDFIFTPVLFENDQNIRQRIPLSLRFGLSIRRLKRNWHDCILFFHRIEPVIFFNRKQGTKIALVHNDIIKQIYSKDSEVIWSKIPRLYQLFERSILRRFHHVFSVSKTTVDYYKKTYPRHSIEFSFLPTSVDPEIFSPSNIPKVELKKDIAKRFPIQFKINEPWFLFVGRLQTQKNPSLLIESFAQYYQKHKQGKLLVVGDGNMKESLIELVTKYGIQNEVIFLGQQSRETLQLFYHGSDSLMLTSFFEGMPVCVLESLASGLPVISANVGEIARLVKNGFSGRIIDSYKVEDYLSAMEVVSANAKEYSAANCVKSIEPYTAKKVILPLYETFRELNQTS